MFAVMVFDELIMDYMVVFEGSLEECEEFALEDEEFFVEEL